jgi:hypothetical protein
VDKGLLIGLVVKCQGHSGPFLNERLRHVLIHMQTKYAGIGPKDKIYWNQYTLSTSLRDWEHIYIQTI